MDVSTGTRVPWRLLPRVLLFACLVAHAACQQLPLQTAPNLLGLESDKHPQSVPLPVVQPQPHGPHPAILCVGVAKAGTSLIYDHLTRLFPDKVSVPAKREMNGLSLHNLPYEKAELEAYYKGLNPAAGKLTLDVSPAYFWSQAAPLNARVLLPNGTKTLLLLRDPISMVLAFLNHRKGREGVAPEDGILLEELDATEVLMVELALLQRPATYAKLIQAATATPSAGLVVYRELSIEIDKEMVQIFGPKYTMYGHGYLLPGFFLPSLRHWYEEFFRFNTDGVLVVLADEYAANAQKTLREAIIPFIFGPDAPLPSGSAWDELASPHESRNIVKRIPPQLRCALAAFYRPFDCMMADTLRKAGAVFSIYPPERLSAGDCNLWEDDDTARVCGLGEYSNKVASRLAARPVERMFEQPTPDGAGEGGGSSMVVVDHGAAAVKVLEGKADAVVQPAQSDSKPVPVPGTVAEPGITARVEGEQVRHVPLSDDAELASDPLLDKDAKAKLVKAEGLTHPQFGGGSTGFGF